ncbi:hypothetical protein BHM03_00012860, partial [Ensete ventricosum]
NLSIIGLTEDQATQLLYAFWIQANRADNKPSDFQAIAHSFSLTLISLHLKVSVYHMYWFEISSCTVRYGQYIPVRPDTGTRTTRYRVVPSNPKSPCVRRAVWDERGEATPRSCVGRGDASFLVRNEQGEATPHPALPRSCVGKERRGAASSPRSLVASFSREARLF